jgi:hypothetical protein
MLLCVIPHQNRVPAAVGNAPVNVPVDGVLNAQSNVVTGVVA